MTWIDTPWPQDPKRLKANGYDIMRYICSDWNTGPGTSMPNKRIDRPELDGYLAAGVDVAVNFEDAEDDYKGGYSRGNEKGKRAGDWMLNVLNFTPGAVCCSSIDYDIGETWGGAAQQYQNGFADGLRDTGPYLPGVYGAAIALNGALADGTAHMFWLTAATYWSHDVQPEVVHLRQNGLWPFGNDADLNLTVMEPIGSYLHPLGAPDMPLSDDDLFKIRQQLIIALADPTHSYLQDEFTKSNTAVLAGVKTMLSSAIDQAALQRVIVAAIADALSAGIPVDVVEQAVEQAVTDALAAATIPVVLTGHAGTPPVTP